MLMHIDPFKISSVAEARLGQMGAYNGKLYRYAKAGGSNLAKGKLVVAPDPVANHIDLAPVAAYAIGTTTIQLTLGATAATADQYKGGSMVIQDGTGEGRSYYIEGNTAAGSAGTITVYLREGIDTAMVVANTKVDLLASDYNGVVISATDQADRALGVPNVAITAAYYGWIQTMGNCSVLMDEAVAVGLALTIGTGVAGAVEALDGAGEQDLGVVSQTAGVDTEYQNVWLHIDRGYAL
jgi:hypothetical protein